MFLGGKRFKKCQNAKKESMTNFVNTYKLFCKADIILLEDPWQAGTASS